MGMYSSLASIDALLDRKYTSADIQQALADLKAMYEAKNIKEHQYTAYKRLLEDKLLH